MRSIHGFFALLLSNIIVVFFSCDWTALAQGTALACNATGGCQNCLSNSNGCEFIVGLCKDSCGNDTSLEGATCYSSSTAAFSNKSPQAICQLEQQDLTLCSSNADCATCTSTLKSDGLPCNWYQQADACFGGGCGPFACGSLTCQGATTAAPTTEPPTSAPKETPQRGTGPPVTQVPEPAPPTVAPTSEPPTEPPTATPTGAPVSCGSLQQCEACVDTGCAFAVSACLDSCDAIADGKCYSLSQPTMVDMTSKAVCQLYRNALTDAAACSAGTDCASCTSTQLLTKSSTCYWFAGMDTCSSERCNQTGTCGVSTCDASPDAICQAAGSNCATCLEANCSWVSAGELCSSACDAIGDTACYSSDTFPQFDNSEICTQASTDEADLQLCFGQMDCETCVMTEKSDNTTCQWYIDQTTGIQWCQTVSWAWNTYT